MVPALWFNPESLGDVDQWLDDAWKQNEFPTIFEDFSYLITHLPALPVIAKLAFLEGRLSEFEFVTLDKLTAHYFNQRCLGFFGENGFTFSRSDTEFLVSTEGCVISWMSKEKVSNPKNFGSECRLAVFCCWLGYLIGNLSGALEIVISHVSTRKQFGRPVGSFQLVQSHVVSNFLIFENLRNSLFAFTDLSMSETEKLKLKTFVKRYSRESFDRIDRLIQACGGIGFTREFPLSCYFLRLVQLLSLMI
ncbi:MAG: acyl-CoA dehydrogenase family protein [Deltaproteobacteria bacterium]|nr:acyl-CoA dehydrogenase family protein [Deltaproteobacteria bacterium]